jgi:hypothetical protein
MEGTEHRSGSFEQQDPRLDRVHRPVVLRKDLVGELRHLTRQLHAGGTATDHHEGEPRRAFPSVVAELGHLEGEQDLVTQVPRILHRLHPRSELCELLPPK